MGHINNDFYAQPAPPSALHIAATATGISNAASDKGHCCHLPHYNYKSLIFRVKKEKCIPSHLHLDSSLQAELRPRVLTDSSVCLTLAFCSISLQLCLKYFFYSLTISCTLTSILTIYPYSCLQLLSTSPVNLPCVFMSFSYNPLSPVSIAGRRMCVESSHSSMTVHGIPGHTPGQK